MRDEVGVKDKHGVDLLIGGHDHVCQRESVVSTKLMHSADILREGRILKQPPDNRRLAKAPSHGMVTLAIEARPGQRRIKMSGGSPTL